MAIPKHKAELAPRAVKLTTCCNYLYIIYIYIYIYKIIIIIIIITVG